MQAFSRNLLLIAALSWVAPVSAQQRDTHAKECDKSHASYVVASAEGAIDSTLIEPTSEALLP